MNSTMAAEADRTALQENRTGFNQQQYEILKRCSENRNIAEWNNYRARQPDARVELQNADLRGANLEGAQLGGGNLRGARFDRADLLAADFRGADLRNASFERANLWGATLSQANLERACLVSANLENADLRRANLERVNLQGANLDGAFIPEVADESLSGFEEQEQQAPTEEVTVSLVDDITYEEFISLTKCLERLSLLVGGSLPHLNEIKISHHTDEHPAWAGTEMGNMISMNIPEKMADNLHGILHAATAAGQGTSGGLRQILAMADFSHNELEAVYANCKLPRMEEDKLMGELGIVADLVKCERIFFSI